MNRKNRKEVFAFVGIAFILYSAFVWLIPWEKNALLILSYLFSFVAFLAQAIVWKMAWENSDTAMSKFYGIPVMRLGLIYLITQVISSFIVMLFSEIPSWIPVLWYIIVLCLFLMGIISSVKIKEQIDHMETEQKRTTSPIKELRAEAEYLYHAYPENKKLLQIKNKLMYSDPVSSDKLLEQEMTLKLLLKQIQQALEQNKQDETENLADHFLVELEKRNTFCKMNK